MAYRKVISKNLTIFINVINKVSEYKSALALFFYPETIFLLKMIIPDNKIFGNDNKNINVPHNFAALI